MPRTYEYYIWSAADDSDDDLMERIQEALRDANLECEYKNFEED